LKFKKFKYDRQSVIISISALLFGLAIVLLSALSCSRYQVQAQAGVTAEKEEMKDAVQMEEQKTEDSKVDYYLPYPGILPDHPLYWLKMIRDKVMISFATSSEQKMQRLLLYADKRIGAAQALIDGGKKELGVTTATKAEKYLERTISEYKKLQGTDKATPEMATRLSKATAKHLEVLMEMVDQVPDQSKPSLQQYLDQTSGYHQWLEEVRLGK
jgi:hypothetical protein